VGWVELCADEISELGYQSPNKRGLSCKMVAFPKTAMTSSARMPFCATIPMPVSPAVSFTVVLV